MLRPADHIRDEAAAMGFATADKARRLVIKQMIAKAFGYSNQQITSALKPCWMLGS